MNPFEYVSVAISIVLALCLGKLLSGVVVVLRSPSRDYLHIAWYFMILLAALTHWMAVWAFSDVTHWNALQFFSVMLTPMLLYIAAHLAVSSSPDEVADWTAYFTDISRILALVMGLTMLSYLLWMYVVLGLFVAGPPTFAILALLAAASIFRNRILSAVAILAFSVGLVLSVLSLQETGIS